MLRSSGLVWFLAALIVIAATTRGEAKVLRDKATRRWRGCSRMLERSANTTNWLVQGLATTTECRCC